MNGSIAIGSRRTTPTSPTAAAVVSDDRVEPRYTPCAQSRASVTSGTVVLRRPPNRMAEIGTPAAPLHRLGLHPQGVAGLLEQPPYHEVADPVPGVLQRGGQHPRRLAGPSQWRSGIGAAVRVHQRF